MIGKTVNQQFISLEQEYLKRLKHYVSIEYTVIPEAKNTKSLSENEQKQKEGELLLKQINQGDEVALLDEKGDKMNSREFAGFIEKKQISSTKRLVFIIGGPYGFSDEVYKNARHKVSLSDMTFSHQMVRVIFLEQLYRVFTILNNEPYHHD